MKLSSGLLKFPTFRIPRIMEEIMIYVKKNITKLLKSAVTFFIMITSLVSDLKILKKKKVLIRSMMVVKIMVSWHSKDLGELFSFKQN